MAEKTIGIRPETHRKLKIYGAQNGLSMSDAIDALLQQDMKRHAIPEDLVIATGGEEDS